MFSIQDYKLCLHRFCETIKLDYFPQMQASDLLYKVITMNDLYIPVHLVKPEDDILNYNVNYDGIQDHFNKLDIDELISIIDAKIVELERKRAEGNGLQDLLCDKTDEKKNNLKNAVCVQKNEKESERWVKFSPNAYRQNNEKPPNLIIRADPGSGKTIFCKKLILAALENDRCFFEDALTRTKLRYSDDILPVLMMFRNINDIKEMLVQNVSFEEVLYCFSRNILGEEFSHECTCEDFFSLLSQEKKDLYLVIDGWDEIFDSDLQRMLTVAIKNFIKERQDLSIVFTIRKRYALPGFFESENNDIWDLKQLDTNEIIEYSRKYYDIIYKDNYERRSSYVSVAGNIIKASKFNRSIAEMSKTPLTLSQLLTVSRYDGHLPENKAELNYDLLELYVGWASKKSVDNISHNKMCVLLAYIACYLTKNNKFLCSVKELKEVIKACIKDLSGFFSDEFREGDIIKLIAELEHTVIFGREFGDTYGFVTHRTMQEYLTAYAIVTQNADAEYNEMNPIDIFRGKYLVRTWREVIVFAVLMNDGRLRQEIVNDLVKISEEKKENNYVYTNLLFDFILNAVPIKLECRHQIYELLFKNYITDAQIEKIYRLMLLENDLARDFSEYISGKFSESVSNNNDEYGDAMAIIKASKLLKDVENNECEISDIMDISRPYLLYEAEKMILDGCDKDIMLGYNILNIIAWCKYVNVENAFCIGIDNYYLSDKIIAKTKQYIINKFHVYDIAISIKHCILAGFVSFEDIVNKKMYEILIGHLNEGEGYAAVLLSLGPVRGKKLRCAVELNEKVRKKYTEQLENEITKKEIDDIVYTYSICAIFDDEIRNAESETWKRVKSCYDDEDGYSIGGCRFKQINDNDIGQTMVLNPRSSSSWLDTFSHVKKNDRLIDEIKLGAARYDLYVEEFILEGKMYLMEYSPRNITDDCVEFIKCGYRVDNITTKNNLAYLHRRREIFNIMKMEHDELESVNPKELLDEGVRCNNPFSLINYALTMTSYDNWLNKGSVYDGLDYIINQTKDDDDKARIEWQRVQKWWRHVLLDIDNVEGLIVFYWLYKIGKLNLKKLDSKVMNTLADTYLNNSFLVDDVSFGKALSECANKTL